MGPPFLALWRWCHGVWLPPGGCSRRGTPPIASSQSPPSFVSVCGENCARSLAPPFPTAQGAAGAPFGSAKKRTRRARWKRKSAWTRSGAVALRTDGGRRTGACSDLDFPSGTL